MKKFIPIFIVLTITLVVLVVRHKRIKDSDNIESTIIPVPVSLVPLKSPGFLLTNETVIRYDSQAFNSAQFLADYCEIFYGLSLNKTTTNSKAKGRRILLRHQPGMNPGQYVLTVKGKKIEITGSEEGIFYGVQSLIQLLPAETTADRDIRIPGIKITDSPRFAWRGMLLDVSRHFYTMEFLKKCVDFAALHKMNYFQLHLTDEQGWRIEIKKYPELNRIGSWRNGTMIGLWPGTGNDGIRHGGYYTQDEIRELISYAARKYVTIVPEIEMPGHALAALASYNYLGCTGGPYEVKQSWGYGDDVFCAGKETTYEFLQNVMDEVIDMFPSQYIHIGGDECPVSRWEKCKDCQARIRNEGLENIHGLQPYFINRMAQYIATKGRTIIGWDEINEKSAPEGAVIMSWRGGAESGCLKAVRAGHQVILAPSFGFYLDYPQTSKEDSLAANWGGVTPLRKTYEYEPVNDSVKTEEIKLILGGQVAIWTEYINNPSKVEYMAFPRLSAASEVLWSAPESRNWDNFKKRLDIQYKRFKLWGISFNPANPDNI